MSSSTKGLTKSGDGYGEYVEGWECCYMPGRPGSVLQPSGFWHVKIYRSRGCLYQLGQARGRTLRAARAAARAVVMERETRGLVPFGSRGWEDDSCWFSLKPRGWHWVRRDLGGDGVSPTLAEARKAAREAT
jgi:hypothetical protein